MKIVAVELLARGASYRDHVEIMLPLIFSAGQSKACKLISKWRGTFVYS